MEDEQNVFENRENSTMIFITPNTTDIRKCDLTYNQNTEDIIAFAKAVVSRDMTNNDSDQLPDVLITEKKIAADVDK